MAPAHHRIIQVSFCPFPIFSRCVLVLSFVLVCSVLVCPRLAFCTLSSLFPPVFLPRGGGWSRFCSVVIPSFLRSSFLCLSLLLTWPGEGCVVLFSPVPDPSGVFPCLPCLSFFILSSGCFCSVLCPSPGFPSFLFFPSLFGSLSFLISFFPRAGGGWSLYCYCCVVVLPSFLFPLSFLLSSFPGGGGNVLICPSLSVFPSFPFLSLAVLSSFLPSFCGGMVGYVSGVCCSPLSLLPFRPSFLPPGWLVQIRKSNSR